MIDVDLREELPFETASNRWFLALLGTGVLLLLVVAAAGRSPVTVAAVTLYLLAIPAFLAVRVWLWEAVVHPETTRDSDDEDEDDRDDEGADPDE